MGYIITLKYATGEMTVDCKEFVQSHNYGKTYVKRLLKLCNAENRAVMLETLRVLQCEIKSEYKTVVDDSQREIDIIDEQHLCIFDYEKAVQPIRKRRDAKRKKLSKKYAKVLKLIELIGEVI